MNSSGRAVSSPVPPTYLGMGSNLGDREAFLEQGLAALRDSGIRPRRVSTLYDTDPVDLPDQASFLNLAVEVVWTGEPRELLRLCQEAERSAGRTRRIRNGPRTLDIDILLRGRLVLREEGLEIPHPRLHLRRFVLVPLAEIAPRAIHPLLDLTVAELLARCRDPSGVRPTGRRPSLERPPPSGYNPAASRGNG